MQADSLGGRPPLERAHGRAHHVGELQRPVHEREPTRVDALIVQHVRHDALHEGHARLERVAVLRDLLELPRADLQGRRGGAVALGRRDELGHRLRDIVHRHERAPQVVQHDAYQLCARLLGGRHLGELHGLGGAVLLDEVPGAEGVVHGPGEDELPALRGDDLGPPQAHEEGHQCVGEHCDCVARAERKLGGRGPGEGEGGHGDEEREAHARVEAREEEHERVPHGEERAVLLDRTRREAGLQEAVEPLGKLQADAQQAQEGGDHRLDACQGQVEPPGDGAVRGAGGAERHVDDRDDDERGAGRPDAAVHEAHAGLDADGHHEGEGEADRAQYEVGPDHGRAVGPLQVLICKGSCPLAGRRREEVGRLRERGAILRTVLDDSGGCDCGCAGDVLQRGVGCGAHLRRGHG
mmetsp:Transcript_1498/g.4714  ORF Transcript_1498/g.4714 Transcript_1498/m.4714 type:complete len:410 (+) Transcript_1498:1247-2476(+)